MAWETLRGHGLPNKAGRVDCRDSGGKGGGFGEVDGRAGDVVEVVGEDVQGDVGHDLGDLGVPVAGVTHGGDVGLGHDTPLLHDRPGEAEQHAGLLVGGRPSAAVEDVLLGQPGPLAQRQCADTQ